MSILITGGAGYIGSHIAWAIKDCGMPYIIMDRAPKAECMRIPPNAPYEQGGIEDESFVEGILKKYEIKAVIHTAGLTDVAQSMHSPLPYYFVNTEGTRRLINACLNTGVAYFIFSSTAAIYGNNPKQIVNEESSLDPQSPYAHSKLFAENILKNIPNNALKFCILRYFNVAGADSNLRSGPGLKGATHLVKIVCEVATGQREHIIINGNDYPTQDGTGVRDFIHVSDLAAAHLSVLNALYDGRIKNSIFNVGYGNGYSVLEIINAMEVIAKKKIPYKIGPRRDGDVVALMADPALLKSQTGWTFKHNTLEDILLTALSWEQKHRP